MVREDESWDTNPDMSETIVMDELVEKGGEKHVSILGSTLFPGSPLLFPLPPCLFNHQPLPLKLLHRLSPFLLKHLPLVSSPPSTASPSSAAAGKIP